MVGKKRRRGADGQRRVEGGRGGEEGKKRAKREGGRGVRDEGKEREREEGRRWRERKGK